MLFSPSSRSQESGEFDMGHNCSIEQVSFVELDGSEEPEGWQETGMTVEDARTQLETSGTDIEESGMGGDGEQARTMQMELSLAGLGLSRTGIELELAETSVQENSRTEAELAGTGTEVKEAGSDLERRDVSDCGALPSKRQDCLPSATLCGQVESAAGVPSSQLMHSTEDSLSKVSDAANTSTQAPIEPSTGYCVNSQLAEPLEPLDLEPSEESPSLPPEKAMPQKDKPRMNSPPSFTTVDEALSFMFQTPPSCCSGQKSVVKMGTQDMEIEPCCHNNTKHTEAVSSQKERDIELSPLGNAGVPQHKSMADLPARQSSTQNGGHLETVMSQPSEMAAEELPVLMQASPRIFQASCQAAGELNLNSDYLQQNGESKNGVMDTACSSESMIEQQADDLVFSQISPSALEAIMKATGTPPGADDASSHENGAWPVPKKSNQTEEKACERSSIPCVKNQSPHVGDQSPLVGDQSPLVGDQSPLVGDQSPLVGDQSPLVGDQSPLVGDQSSLVGDQSSLVGDQSSLVGDQSPYIREQTSHLGLQSPHAGHHSAHAGQQSHVGSLSKAFPTTLSLKSLRSKKFFYPTSNQITASCPRKVFNFEVERKFKPLDTSSSAANQAAPELGCGDTARSNNGAGSCQASNRLPSATSPEMPQPKTQEASGDYSSSPALEASGSGTEQCRGCSKPDRRCHSSGGS